MQVDGMGLLYWLCTAKLLPTQGSLLCLGKGSALSHNQRFFYCTQSEF